MIKERWINWRKGEIQNTKQVSKAIISSDLRSSVSGKTNVYKMKVDNAKKDSQPFLFVNKMKQTSRTLDC